MVKFLALSMCFPRLEMGVCHRTLPIWTYHLLLTLASPSLKDNLLEGNNSVLSSLYPPWYPALICIQLTLCAESKVWAMKEEFAYTKSLLLRFIYVDKQSGQDLALSGSHGKHRTAYSCFPLCCLKWLQCQGSDGVPLPLAYGHLSCQVGNGSRSREPGKEPEPGNWDTVKT